MALYFEDFATPANGDAITSANVTGLTIVKVGAATLTCTTAWAYPGAGSKSARAVVTTATDAVYGLKSGYTDSVASMALGMKWNALPIVGATTSCKLLVAKNSGGTNIAQLRYVGATTAAGCIYQVLDASGAVKHSSPAFIAGPAYYLQMIVTPGTTAGNGRIQTQILQDGSVFDSYDSGATLNTGTSTLAQYQWMKMDATGVLDADFAHVALDSGGSAFIPPPASASANANAGPNSFVDAFTGWLAGDGAAARVQLDGTSSTGTGTLTYAWTGPGGVSFVAPGTNTAGAALAAPEVVLPQGLTDQLSTLTLTVTSSDGATDTDTVDVTVRGAEQAWLRSDGVWRPARLVAL